MANLNKVMLIGNLTRDPELRYIPSGQAVTTFTIAVSRTYNSKTGDKKEEVAFIRIVAWARLAEICNEYLKKGRPVFVEGRIQTRSWDGPDGNKRYATEVLADNVQFLGSKPAGGGKSEGSEMPTMDVDDSIFESSEGSASSKKNSVSLSKDELKPDEEIPF
jgi:single-strand DNA-binding protein